MKVRVVFSGMSQIIEGYRCCLYFIVLIRHSSNLLPRLQTMGEKRTIRPNKLLIDVICAIVCVYVFH